jgi:predicted nucleic acid-binding protein
MPLVPRIVVDASVILKWVLGSDREPDHGCALRILDDWAADRIELMVPSLWEYEVGNILGRELRHEAFQKMMLLRNLGMIHEPLNEEMIGLCFQWMDQLAVTFYDASYLALAVVLEGRLVTADRRFAQRMARPDRILLVSDYGKEG